jgi:hypothetical protein
VEFISGYLNEVLAFDMNREEIKVLNGVDVIEVPTNYIETPTEQALDSTNRQKMKPIDDRYNRFLGSLLHSRVPFGFRLQTSNQTPRIHYLTDDHEKNKSVLVQSFCAYFPDFSSRIEEISNNTSYLDNLSLAHIWGAPRRIVGSLNGLARFMLGSRCYSIYQAWAIPKSPSRIKRLLIKHKLEAALQKSQQQETLRLQVSGSSTRTKYNIRMASRARQLEGEYKRLASSTLLDCHVILAFWNCNQSHLALENALGILFGTISHEDRELAMRCRIYTENKAQRLLGAALSLNTTNKSTKLLPAEFVPLVEIPRTEFSIRQGYSASFSTAASVCHDSQSESQKGFVTLGNLYAQRSLNARRIKQLSLEQLRRHVAIIGTTGSGKSSTKHRIVIDAWKNGVSSLLIEPVKADARILMGAINELRVFTLGLEQVTPFRLNPLHVQEGVHVGTHVDLLVSSFMAAWPVYGILVNHLRRVIIQTYINNGWDVVRNIRGPEITLDSLLSEARRYADKLAYGTETNKDFRGAILARIEDLCDPARAAIFNTLANLSIDELLSVPTIIELKHIADPEFRSFILSLLLIRIYEHFDRLGSSDKLRNLLIIDEAHSVLAEIPPTADTNEIAAAKRKTTEQLVNLIAESRDYGLGVIILDQNATRLSRDALKTCHTKIIHCNTSEPDRNLLASETGCNKEQTKQIDVLRVGEVIMRGPEEAVPVNVQVFYDPDTYPDMKRKWTNKDVVERMKDFYNTHRKFAKTPEPPVLLDIDETQEQESVSIAVQVEEIVRDEGFRNLYLGAVEESSDGTVNSIEELLSYYAVHLAGDSPLVFGTVNLLQERASDLYGAPPKSIQSDVIRRLVGKYVKQLSENSETG